MGPDCLHGITVRGYDARKFPAAANDGRRLGPMTDLELRIRIVPSLAEIPAAAWNACAGQRAWAPAEADLADYLSPELSTRG